MNSWTEYTDDQLCSMVSNGDRKAEEAIVTRYNRLVRACARPYFLAGGDSEDLIQEGMVGLLKAVREYDPAKQASFRTYAEICIRSRLYSAIKAAARDKHTPLNRSIPLETPFFDKNTDLMTYRASNLRQNNPEELIIGREEFAERLDGLKGQLSEFEAKILGYYLKGLSYLEIAAEVNRSPKSVDNAVQRIRRKLAQQINPGDFSKS
ncbi:sigma-70 family RNA polymerase sigma factor [Papillibacter cinnamivorans]|uniref:RNA polymerase sigma factor SigS n=1 Tax=Papillibacter cinnamivorans DSM 12816 TaxID=1122930 RepID=A0A1W1ZR90_9FIRM|nr:sigma-70 family RNA polymerase sigma factor [Papillibacter cinnamivorans]SMC51055.1 RNA polymerase sporulation-specific sigma factor [Papillibacter cinnamivorans DSM 12816]